MELSAANPKKKGEAVKKSTQQSRRRAALAKIHIAKKQLQLDEETYRAMLWEVAEVDSAADLDLRGLDKVLDHLADRGAKFTDHGRQPGKITPHRSKRRLLWKIYQLLGDRSPKYAAAILRNQGGPDALEWATPTQLHKVVAALEYDRKRKAKRAAAQRGAVDLDLLIDGVLTFILGVVALAAWYIVMIALEG